MSYSIFFNYTHPLGQFAIYVCKNRSPASAKAMAGEEGDGRQDSWKNDQ